MNSNLSEGSLLAAIDLGSNSFHLAIARLDHGEVRRIDSLSDKVQLGAGLDKDKNLTPEAQERALACLARFAQRLQSIPLKRLRIVATNALRQANNSATFIEQAERILKKRIEIVAGREEARLIYLGVSQTLADEGRRLVVDIGGGSTEFIIGENFEPLATESLQMVASDHHQPRTTQSTPFQATHQGPQDHHAGCYASSHPCASPHHPRCACSQSTYQ
jgi:exopolyphosphatase/guanosine-5'-triphosphate,3'-diphosphate pyrophosphatase